MNNYFSHHAGYQKDFKNREKIYNASYSRHKKDLKKYLDKFTDAKILEIGCGMGKFTYFCNKIGVKNYVGIDIDIHLIFIFFTKIYFLGMGEKFPEFYTRDFINVLTKKGKN